MKFKILHQASLLRLFLVVVLLLKVLVINAENLLATGANAGTAVETKKGGTVAIYKKKTSPESYSPFATLKQNFSTEATIFHGNFTLQQVLIAVLSKSFAFPSDEIIPVILKFIPGIRLIAQIVPITILPNGP